MPKKILYSTNAYIKYFVNNKFRGGKHFVWCSEYFDSTKISKYGIGSQLPPSSNPLAIYKDLNRAVELNDLHNTKIASQRALISKLAIDWETKGYIDCNERDEIIYIAKTASLGLWRPLIYVIPSHPVKDRLQLVPIAQRAGIEDEYIIKDLDNSEFEIIEV